MYSSLPTFVIGFHGCDKKVQQRVISGKGPLSGSNNDYDWLGNGVYFWENSPVRALEFAKFIKDNPNIHSTKINTPAVVGAVIDLGNCFNLVDSHYIEILRVGYDLLKSSTEKAGYPLPKNTCHDEGGYVLKRKLDCAVMEAIHAIREKEEEAPFDTVRGVFPEGRLLYPSAGFNTKTHIQLCVRNPNCIKGYFNPLKPDPKFPIP